MKITNVKTHEHLGDWWVDFTLDGIECSTNHLEDERHAKEIAKQIKRVGSSLLEVKPRRDRPQIDTQ